MSALTSSATWQALTTQAERLRGMSLRAAFADDLGRFGRFSLRWGRMRALSSLAIVASSLATRSWRADAASRHSQVWSFGGVNAEV